VIATVREDDLPALSALKDAERRWSIHATGSAPVESTIDDIGYLVDPKTHTAIVKGYIDNKDNRLRAGQYVTASVTLRLVADEVSVPTTAVVEEKGQTFVFVQPDPKKPVYEQRRVVIVRRGSDTVHVRTKLTSEENRQGAQPVRPGERVGRARSNSKRSSRTSKRTSKVSSHKVVRS
jgi:cobalt-zinc-cadmium efflux system membrane fusion protein